MREACGGSAGGHQPQTAYSRPECPHRPWPADAPRVALELLRIDRGRAELRSESCRTAAIHRRRRPLRTHGQASVNSRWSHSESSSEHQAAEQAHQKDLAVCVALRGERARNTDLDSCVPLNMCSGRSVIECGTSRKLGGDGRACAPRRRNDVAIGLRDLGHCGIRRYSMFERRRQARYTPCTRRGRGRCASAALNCARTHERKHVMRLAAVPQP